MNSNFIQEVDSTGTRNYTYYYDEFGLVARKDSDGKKYFYHTDILGGINVVTDESGKVVAKLEYTPYGENLIDSSERFQFTGEEKDNATGLYYLSSRYYSPYLMHFTQPDTVLPNIYDPQQLNRYSYARNNPVKYVDPSGHAIDAIFDVGFILYDIKSLFTDGWAHVGDNLVSLGLDAICAFIPVVTGGGMIYRAGKTVDRVSDGIRFVDKTLDTSRVVDKTIDATKIVDRGIDIKRSSEVISASEKMISVSSKSVLSEYSQKRLSKELLNEGKVTVGSYKEANALRAYTFPTAQKIPGAGPLAKESTKKLSKLPNTYHTDYLMDYNTNKIFGHEYSIHGNQPHINIKDMDKQKYTIIIDNLVK